MAQQYTMTDGLKRACDFIAENSGYVNQAIALHSAVWRGERVDAPPLMLSCWLTDEQRTWLVQSNYKAIHFDSEKMLANELQSVLTAINGNSGAVPSMRANMGCGIVSTLVGLEQSLFEDKMPWMLRHLKKEEIKPRYDFSVDSSSEFAAAMRHMEYMQTFLREQRLDNVFIFPLDLQGAVDTAHLIYGDAIFYDFYDDPDLIHHLLRVSCDAVEFAIRECFARIRRSEEFVTHYNSIVIPRALGGLKVSEDTTTLLSPDLIDTFALPYLRDILTRFNGGYVHYCGKNDHLLDILLNEPLVRGINFGNPNKHDMTAVLNRFRDKGKIYVGAANRLQDESQFDYFKRILGASYNPETGCFAVMLHYWCSLQERDGVLDDYARAAACVRCQ
ncbi:MAG: hypothetical protein FWD61_02015 [Phycisphaerales bacterium]|nr:hypothetical protein [Phycisphaerales bacterium]